MDDKYLKIQELMALNQVLSNPLTNLGIDREEAVIDRIQVLVDEILGKKFTKEENNGLNNIKLQ